MFSTPFCTHHGNIGRQRNSVFCTAATWLGVALLVLSMAGPMAGESKAEEAPQNKVFRAGAFAADITPQKFPIAITGSMGSNQATGVHDPLHARCLVLDDGQTSVAIVVCDSCAIPREVFDEAKRLASKTTGIATERMLMSATHTHSAPSAVSAFQNDADADYQRFLVEQIAKGVQRAHANLEPARVGWAVGEDPDHVFCRRWILKPGTVPEDPFGRTTDRVKMNPGFMNPDLVKPAGPVDPEVSIFSVQSRDGRPIALLANYSLHYVGEVAPVSADYFGCFAERIKELVKADQLDPPFVGIMSNGTSGDVNKNNYGQPAPPRRGSYEAIREVTESVAQVALAAYNTIEYRDWVPLAMSQREIELGVRRPNAEEIARAQKLLDEAGAPPYTDRAAIYARETLFLAKYPATVKMKLQAVRIGELGIASSPCETFAITGLAIKKNSPLKPTFTIELANGYNGYLPTPEQHELGGYETWRARSAYLAEQSEPKIRATLLELLGEVAK